MELEGRSTAVATRMSFIKDLRQRCSKRGTRVELQVHGQRNQGAKACYERLGGRAVAWGVDGILAGEGKDTVWRVPERGQLAVKNSTSGRVIFWQNAPLVWGSRKQNCVKTSSIFANLFRE